jgi:hypothetical protein
VEKPSTSNLFALIVCGLFAVGRFIKASGSTEIRRFLVWQKIG